MSTFMLYVRDDRYRVPTLDIVSAAGEADVRTLATKRLFESSYHTAVDVYEGEELRFSVEPSGWRPIA